MRNKLIAFILVVFVLENCGCEKDNVTAPPNWDLSGRIVFNPISGSGENRGILVLDLNSPALSLTTLVHDGIEPRVNREGSEVVFTGWQPGCIDIFTTKISGGNTIDLTPDPFLTDSWPDWSPDGQSIVFNRVHYPVTKEALYVISKDGSNLHALTDTSSLAVALMPRWSPDGSKIGFIGRVELSPVGKAKYSLYTITPDGLMEVLANRPAFAMPRWSPDSRRIAYGKTFRAVKDTSGGVFVFDLVSKLSQQISFRGTPSFPAGFSWLSDDRLCCVGVNWAEATYLVFISSMSVQADQDSLATGFKDIPATCPSPDGKFIAIFGQRKDDATLAVYVVESDGTDFRKFRDTGISGHITDYYYCQWIK